jgi:hypothetical protein
VLASRSNTVLTWAVVALLTISFAGTVVGHHHEGNSAADCQVCHFSHIPILQPGLQATLAKPECTSALLIVADHFWVSDPELSSESSRAPPSA